MPAQMMGQMPRGASFAEGLAQSLQDLPDVLLKNRKAAMERALLALQKRKVESSLVTEELQRKLFTTNLEIRNLEKQFVGKKAQAGLDRDKAATEYYNTKRKTELGETAFGKVKQEKTEAELAAFNDARLNAIRERGALQDQREQDRFQGVINLYSSVVKMGLSKESLNTVVGGLRGLHQQNGDQYAGMLANLLEKADVKKLNQGSGLLGGLSPEALSTLTGEELVLAHALMGREIDFKNFTRTNEEGEPINDPFKSLASLLRKIHSRKGKERVSRGKKALPQTLGLDPTKGSKDGPIETEDPLSSLSERSGWTHEEAMQILKEGTKKHSKEKIVRAFKTLEGIYVAGDMTIEQARNQIKADVNQSKREDREHEASLRREAQRKKVKKAQKKKGSWLPGHQGIAK